MGHQSYTHKILSGRKDAFDGLRQFGGIAGFPKRNESSCDAFNTGHSSTSISAALGLAKARDIKKEDRYIISVIGDGALTGGMAYEALNNAAQMKTNFIIVLNDNNMSISQNIGGMSKYLNSIRTGSRYMTLKKDVADVLEKIPAIGDKMIGKIKQTKNSIKQLLIPGMLFENMGITYLGPVDGHNIAELEKVLEAAKKVDHAALVHVVTKKGKGYLPAQKHPERFHGVGAFDIPTGKSLGAKEDPDYSDVFGYALCAAADKDPSVVAITAAMPEGTGLLKFRSKYPDRFIDVGIAEAHAITSAAGMAAGGLKPVAAIYSSFLQRGFDQILHDVCIQDLPVVFAIDRAGLVGADGETHQGIFDISFLSCIPNMTVVAPKNMWELKDMLDFALGYGHPIAIRYPRGKAYTGLREFRAPIEFGRSELIYSGQRVALFALGSMVSTAEHVREKLVAVDIDATLVNARSAKPIDTAMLDELASTHKFIITMEENVLLGGMGMAVNNYISEQHPHVKVINIALPDAYVEHGNVSTLREHLGIDSSSVVNTIMEQLSRQ